MKIKRTVTLIIVLLLLITVSLPFSNGEDGWGYKKSGVVLAPGMSDEYDMTEYFDTPEDYFPKTIHIRIMITSPDRELYFTLTYYHGNELITIRSGYFTDLLDFKFDMTKECWHNGCDLYLNNTGNIEVKFDILIEELMNENTLLLCYIVPTIVLIIVISLCIYMYMRKKRREDRIYLEQHQRLGGRPR